jgi:hypothetical protein
VGLLPQRREIHLGRGVSLGPGSFHWGRDHLTDWPPANDSQMILVAVFENGWAPDELAAKLGRVLDLNGRRNGLDSRLVGILAEAIQAVNGK